MVGRPGRPRGLTEQGPGPWFLLGCPLCPPTRRQLPQAEELGRQSHTQPRMGLPSPPSGKEEPGSQRWVAERPSPSQLGPGDGLGTPRERLNPPPHWWKEEPEPEIGQIYRTSFKCHFLHTVVFGLRFVPITMSNFPTPNIFLAVNNAQCNECFIAFLVLLYKYIHTRHLLWLNRTHALWTPNKEHW